jgi:hypothetical protein
MRISALMCIPALTRISALTPQFRDLILRSERSERLEGFRFTPSALRSRGRRVFAAPVCAAAERSRGAAAKIIRAMEPIFGHMRLARAPARWHRQILGCGFRI